MEFRVDALAPLDGHVGRQVSIGAPHPGHLLSIDRSIEVHHLIERVHACIGAPGTGHGHRQIDELRERSLDTTLDRYRAGLALPAAIGPSPVGNAQRESIHPGTWSLTAWLR